MRPTGGSTQEHKTRLLEQKGYEIDHVASGSTPGVCVQLGLLLHKNYLLKKRNWQATLTEILVPVIFACLLLLIRSQIDVTFTPFDYNLNSTTPMLDPVAVGYVFDGITCGAVDPNSGERFQSRAVFGVAGSNATVVAEVDQHIRDLFLALSNTTISPQAVNCSNRPFLCNIPINRDAPQCQGPFQTNTVVLKDIISAPSFVQTYSSRGALEDYMKQPGYAESDDKPPLLFAVSFTESGERGQWDYVLFGNRTIIPETYFGITNDFQTGFDETKWKQYVYSGFIFFQALLDSYIISKNSGDAFLKVFSDTVFKVQFVPFPIPAHNNDKIGQYLNNVIGLFFVLAFMWPFSRLVRNIVQEKEDRIKEGMRMMGMSNAAFWLSWSLMYTALLTFTCLIMTLLLLPFFKYSNAFLIFLILWLFCTSLVALACMVSSLFNASKTAGTLSLAILFLLYIPYNGVVQSGVSPAGKLIGSLCSPTALSLAFDRIITFESAFVGLTWSNVSQLESNFAVSSAMFMMLLDTIIYAIVAWYLDKVIKNQFGTSEPWYFCCSPRYWCSHSARTKRGAQVIPDEDDALPAGAVQPVSEQLRSKLGVELVGLTKQFGSQLAVKNLSLEMYEGQIFVLLGHNGAGKTTTINMLTGLLPITSGKAFIWGKDAAQDINAIRSTLGVCPQHDILFPSLKVKEHLHLYGRLKGVPKDRINEVVEKAIEEIQLEKAADQPAGSLSGGQKRRLSLAIALIGDSKVIFLDEPTSGVDPFSRRAIWDLLQKKKAGRVVILTTHFMDEADQLGDRICIMHHGQLRCCGTSLFLKNIFGVGYNIVMTREGSGQALHEVLKRHIPEAEVLSDVGTELSYRLPLASSPQFPALLRELEQNGPALGCGNFGVSVTTLEEVFLRVAEEQVDLKEQKQTRQLAKKLSMDKNRIKGDDSVLNAQGGPSTSRHFKALLAKRWHNAKRDRKAQCCQFITPVCVLLFGLIMINSFPVPQQEPDLVLTFNHLNQPLSVPVNTMWKNVTTNASRLEGVPYTQINMWDKSFDSLSEFSEQLLQTRSGFQKESRYGAICLASEAAPSTELLHGINFPLSNLFSPRALTADPAKAYNIYVNMTARHGMPMYFNLVTNSLLHQYSSTSLISMSVCRMPATHDEQVIINSFIGLSTSISLALGMAFIPAAYVVFVVKERETNSKHLQLISGVDIRAYWLSNYVFDFAAFLFTATLCIIIIQIFGAQAYRGQNLPVIITTMLLFGLAVIPFSYLWSFLFRSASTAQNVMIMIYIGSGVLLLVMSFVFYSIESTAPYADTIRMFFRFFPNFCLGDTFFYLSLLDVINQFTFEGAPQPWDMQISGWDCVWLGSEAVVYFVMVLGFEYFEAIQQCLFSARPNPKLLNQGLNIVEDEDVEAEKRRIQSGAADGELIRLHGLRRVFPQKVAVNDLWFSIPKNQCFGFLGVNGAGKSTALKMLTGDEVPTAGDAFLGGYSCRTDPIGVRRLMGYCPQFDALHPLMTGQETLEFYGRLRGVPEEKLKDMVNYLCERLTLNQDNQHTRPAGTYSGGNKRKLSVGIALIGNPPVVFLDEPSTGMDPVSRRFMWDFISQTMLDRAVILTTHSMEECEALCSRIGILVHGRLKCIGAAQHLKTRFGTGFEFMLTCQDEYVDQVRSFVSDKFTGVSELECYGGNIKYQLGKQSMALSTIFDLLEANRAALGITEYSIGQSTLEQIFIRFASEGDRELAVQEGVLAESADKPVTITTV